MLEGVKEFALAPDNVAFLSSIVLMLAIVFLELITAVLGFALSSAIDALIPDLDFSLEAEFGYPALGLVDQALGWLYVGRVPVLVLFLIWLTAFGYAGFGLQFLFALTPFGLLSWWGAVSVAFLVSLPILHVVGGWLSTLMPRDMEDAVSEENIQGVGVIMIGKARKGFPAETKYVDEMGRVHYIMVEPDSDHADVQAGDERSSVYQDGVRWREGGVR